jgi:hypothetical protein
MDNVETLAVSPRAMAEARSMRTAGSPGHTAIPGRSGTEMSIQERTRLQRIRGWTGRSQRAS